MTEMQSILCREGLMLLLHDRNTKCPMQRKFYALLHDRNAVSYAEKVLCCCFMTEIKSILCRESFMLLLHHRNKEYPMQRRLSVAAS
jgi:hypothetical protein